MRIVHHDRRRALEDDLKALVATVRKLIKAGVPRKVVLNIGPGFIQDVYVERRDHVIHK